MRREEKAYSSQSIRRCHWGLLSSVSLGTKCIITAESVFFITAVDVGLIHHTKATLCDPRDGSPPGSIPGILQARTLEWVAISFSNAWKWKVKAKSLSRVRPSATPWTAAHPAPLPMGPSRQEYRSGLPLTFIIFSVTDEKVNLRCYKIGKDSLESSTRLLQVVINGVDTWKLQ